VTGAWIQVSAADIFHGIRVSVLDIFHGVRFVVLDIFLVDSRFSLRYLFKTRRGCPAP